jgi:hypothetical protein
VFRQVTAGAGVVAGGGWIGCFTDSMIGAKGGLPPGAKGGSVWVFLPAIVAKRDPPPGAEGAGIWVFLGAEGAGIWVSLLGGF